MCDEWMPQIVLPLTLEQFHQLPRNPAFKYEYLAGQAYLTPRPRHYHGLLELKPSAADASVRVRPFEGRDWPEVEATFAAAFHETQPFGSLDSETRTRAARKCLDRTRSGGDGPWVEQASFVALADHADDITGAIFITLLPEGDPCEYESYYWRSPPPPDLLARRGGQPHLTWIFVAPLHARAGTGTALLTAAANELIALGYRSLLSTFLLGNDSSMLWHWHCGFRLLEHPVSRRAMRRRVRKG
jgi:GNAT superfamily N-acetyltransferase